MVIPDAVTSIGREAFADCDGLTSLTIGNSVTTIGESAFVGCNGLTSLTIGNSVATIGEGAFAGCNGLTSVVIPNPVTTICDYAFAYCSGITMLAIPNTVTSIGDYAFRDCNALSVIIVQAVTSPSLGNYVFYNVPTDIDLFVPCGASGSYRMYGGWSVFSNIIEMCDKTISVAASPSEGGSVSGGGTYTFGQSCTITATTNESYVFLYWTENGEPVSLDAEYTFVVTVDRNLVALFTPVFTIEVLADPENGGLITGAGEYVGGSSCTLTAIAYEDYAFLHWTDNGELVSSEAEYTFIVTTNRNLVAHFSPFFTISVMIEPENGGSITGAGEYVSGSTCTLTASPNDGYTFLYWTENGEQVSSDIEYTFNVSSDRNLMAHFTSLYAIAVSSDPVDGGSILGAGDYYYGTTCTLVASANEGYAFLYWSENGERVSSTAEYSFVVLSSRNLVAHFTLPYTISTIAKPAYCGTVTGAGEYGCGSICTLTATVNDGCHFFGWMENGGIVSANLEYSFVVNGDQELYALYASDNIHFADAAVKAICVANWDTNGDGELSYTEAAAVTNLGTVFLRKGGITSFNELRYFTGLTSIDNNAFRVCANLTSVVFPNTINSIGYQAFAECSRLSSITIPCSVTSIGDYAFRNCSGITLITSLAVTPPSMNENAFYGISVDDVEVRVPCGMGDDYYGASGWNAFWLIIDDYDCGTIYQSSELSIGWNWWTSNGYYSSIGHIQTALGDDLLLIQSKEGVPGFIEPEQMYKILICAPCTLKLWVIEPSASITVNINLGENWFGFIGSEKTVAAAFANFTPAEGDKVISQDEGFAVFENGEWHGTLETLQPGKGYVYVSNATEPKTLVIGE